MLRNLIIIILCGSLAGCQHSPRKHYFILSAASAPLQAPHSPAAQSNTARNSLIGIGPIDIADYLDRAYIGYAENDNTLTILENDYWAEPLDKGVARITVLNLAQLNPGRNFVNFPWRSDSKPQYTLRIQLHSLTRSHNQASIKATWELVDNSNKSNLQRKTFSHEVAVGSDTKALVQAYSQLMAALAEEISQSL